MSTKTDHILILAKTYPSSSAQYSETSCAAGFNEHGEMRRLFPILFRMLEENQRFNKWQWISVRIEKANKARQPEWTAEEKEKLVRQQMQGDLFSEAEARQEVNTLRKVPFDFYYRYACETNGIESEFEHKIVDWEVGALYWNCRRSHGEAWEAPFRAKLESELGNKDLMFLMGNQHRFQHQWLIISLFYPPKLTPNQVLQNALF